MADPAVIEPGVTYLFDKATGELIRAPDQRPLIPDLWIGRPDMNGNGNGDFWARQADAPYTPAGLLFDPGNPWIPQGELPGGIPMDATNISEVIAPSGFGASSSGAPRDTGGIGEWLLNAGKHLSTGFFAGLTAHAGVNRQPGGVISTPGPSMTGRFSSPQLGIGALSSQTMMMLLLLTVGGVLAFGMARR